MFKPKLTWQETSDIAVEIYNFVMRWIANEHQLYSQTEDNKGANRDLFYRWCNLNIGAMTNPQDYQEIVHWLTRGGIDNNQMTVTRIPELITEMCQTYGVDTIKDYIERTVESIAYGYGLPLELVKKLEDETRALWLLKLVGQAQMRGELPTT